MPSLRIRTPHHNLLCHVHCLHPLTCLILTHSRTTYLSHTYTLLHDLSPQHEGDLNAQIAVLVEEIRIQQIKSDKDDATIKELLAKIQKLEEDIQKLKGDVAAAEEKVKEAEEKKKTAEDKAEELEKERDGLTKALDGAYVKIESLERELEEARKRIKELEEKKPGFGWSRFLPQNCARSKV